MKCIDDNTAAEIVEGLIPDDKRAWVESHLDSCRNCRVQVSELAKLLGSSGATLTSLPGSLRKTIEKEGSAPAEGDEFEPSQNGDLDELVTVAAEHYALGREIARGGMGRIVQARDLRLGRSIAIKELLSPSPRLERRFKREMRLTARLQHPAIISVHEAGRWPSGAAFYTMKHVEGLPLDKVIHSRTTLAERLALLPNIIAVAEALAYAHGRRIIHRDLKPANVLVGNYGETVVIDWGLAKYVDADEDRDTHDDTTPDAPATPDLTVLGQTIGTPAYMPPEQAEGRAVGERADVYALGAILYHVLGGKMPYTDSRSAEEVLDKVISGPPVPLRELQPQVPADLLTIVETAMARDTEKRFPSAKEMAKELRRFETGQLVGAHSYSAAALLKRWIRRRRAAVGVAAVMLALGVVGGVLSFSRVSRERDRAEQERREVEELLGFMLGDLRTKLKPIGKLELLDLVARKALDYYDRRPIDWARVEDLRGRSQTLVNVGDVLVAKGNADEALESYRASLVIRQRLGERDPANAIWQRDVSASYDKLGKVLVAQGEVDQAGDAFQRSLAIRERLAKQSPDDADAQLDLSATYTRMGRVLQAQGKLDQELEMQRASLTILARLAQLDPEDGKLQRNHGAALTNVGQALYLRGDHEEALKQYRAALAIFSQRAKGDSENSRAQVDLSMAQGLVALALRAQGNLPGAENMNRAAVEVFVGLVDKDPSNASWRHSLGISHHNLGNVLRLQKKFDQARESLQAAATILEGLAKQDPANAVWQRNLAANHHKMGEALYDQGKLEASLQKYQESTTIVEKLTRDHPHNVAWKRDLARNLVMLALVHRKRGDKEAENRFFGRCAETYGTHGYASEDFYNGAYCYAQAGDMDRAFNLLEKAADGGFHDVEKISKDQEWAALVSDSRWGPLRLRMVEAASAAEAKSGR